MRRFWRYQQTDGLENHPSWHGYGRAELDCPATEEGWDGYWWAWAYDPAQDRPDYAHDYLIRVDDADAAREGEEVELFLPGLCGCETASALLQYVEEQCGGIDSDMYVAVYEGKRVGGVWDGVVFTPTRLLAIYPASELPRLAGNEEEER